MKKMKWVILAVAVAGLLAGAVFYSNRGGREYHGIFIDNGGFYAGDLY